MNVFKIDFLHVLAVVEGGVLITDFGRKWSGYLLGFGEIIVFVVVGTISPVSLGIVISLICRSILFVVVRSFRMVLSSTTRTPSVI